MDGNVDFVGWFQEIPVVSRVWLVLSFSLTAACALDILSPFTLYFNTKLIFENGQIWRLLTNFLFFGQFGIEFLFHMYFLVRYSGNLEQGSFRGRTADFVVFLLFGAVLMTCVAPFISIHFLGTPLTFYMVYVWGRRNPYTRMSLLGIFPFTAPYLPWVLMGFSVLLGHSGLSDLIGMSVGHLYFFAEDVYPKLAASRNWRLKRLICTPRLLRYLIGGEDASAGDDEFEVDNADMMMPPPPPPEPAAPAAEEVAPPAADVGAGEGGAGAGEGGGGPAGANAAEPEPGFVAARVDMDSGGSDEEEPPAPGIRQRAAHAIPAA